MANTFTPGTPTTPTTHAGYRGPNDAVASGRVKADIAEDILFVEAKVAKAAFVANKLNGKKRSTQWKFQHIEKRPYPRDFVLASNYAGGDAPGASCTLTVSTANAAKITANMVIYNAYVDELFWVSAVNTSTGDLTCLANIGGSANSTACTAANSVMSILNSAYVDGSDIGSPRSTVDALVDNYCQIFRTPYGVTGRDENTDMHGGSDLKTERKAAQIEHAKSIENALFHGKPAALTDSTSGKLLTFAGGLDYFITTHVWDLGGTAWPTEDEFIENIAWPMQEGPNGNKNGTGMKYLVCGPGLATQIGLWGLDKLRHTELSRKYGLWCEVFQTPHGEVRILQTPTLSGAINGSKAYLLDMDLIKPRVYQNRDTKVLDNRQGNGIDGMLEEIMTDMGWEIRQDEAHMIIEGLPTAPLGS